MADTTHVKGLAELQKFLDQLPAKIEKNIMRGALRAGMNVVKPVASTKVHSVSGALARGLNVGTNSKGGTVWSRLKAKGPHGYIARFLEYGTLPHFISIPEAEKPINWRLSIKRGEIVRASMTTINRNIRSLKISGSFVGPTVFHPGSQKKAFMRPALDEQASAAVVAAADYIKKRLATKHGIDTSHIMIEGDE